MHQGRTSTIDRDTVHRLAAESHTDPRTARKALEHGPDAIRLPAVRMSIVEAAARLGLPLPEAAT